MVSTEVSWRIVKPNRWKAEGIEWKCRCLGHKKSRWVANVTCFFCGKSLHTYMVGFRPVAIQIQGHDVRILCTSAWAYRLFWWAPSKIRQQGIIRLLLQDALQLVRHNYGTFVPQPDLCRIQQWCCCWSAQVLQAVFVFGVLASWEMSWSCEGWDAKSGKLENWLCI